MPLKTEAGISRDSSPGRGRFSSPAVGSTYECSFIISMGISIENPHECFHCRYHRRQFRLCRHNIQIRQGNYIDQSLVTEIPCGKNPFLQMRIHGGKQPGTDNHSKYSDQGIKVFLQFQVSIPILYLLTARSCHSSDKSPQTSIFPALAVYSLSPCSP